MSQQDFLDTAAATFAVDGLTREEQQLLEQYAATVRDVNLNLAYARTAVSYIRQRMGLVANWDEQLPTSAEGTYRRTGDPALAAAAEDRADQCVYGTLRQTEASRKILAPPPGHYAGVKNITDIQTLARLGETYGCGNCAELAARTFMYLYQILRVRPLDYMRLEGADHVLVVIGRAPITQVEQPDSWLTWGKSAVVCDPWATGLLRQTNEPNRPARPFGDSYSAYPANLLGEKMSAMFPSFQYPVLEHHEY